MSATDANTDPQGQNSLMGEMIRAQVVILALKAELIAYAYHEQASPFMRAAILSSLAHAGLFDADVGTEVAKHPNYTTAFVDPNAD